MIKLALRLLVALTAVAVCFAGLAAPAQAADRQPTSVAEPRSDVVAPVAPGVVKDPSITGPAPAIGLGGCGFLQNCIYFSQRDQRALISGGAAGIAAVICIVGSPAVCVVAAVIVAVAVSYLGSRGICSGSRRLRVRWFPSVGGATCVA